MRVTHAMMIDRLIADLDRARWQLERFQSQAATGKRIGKVSDDPVGAATALRLQARLSENETYLANIQQAKDWLELTDTSLGAAVDVLHRARELAIRGASASETPESRQAMAAEVEGLIAHLVEIGNSKIDGRYLFGGQRTTTPPFAQTGPDTAVYQGDSGAVRRAVGPGVTVTVNVPGDRAFPSTAAGTGAFAALADLRARLLAGDAAGLSTTSLTRVDEAIDGLLRERTAVGALVARLEREEERLRTFQVQGTAILSQAMDADLGEVVLTMRQHELAYRAALAVGARVVQPTLIDFLR